MTSPNIQALLKDKGLKVTPQRVAVLEAFQKLKHHPTTEDIIGFIRKNHPNIATGTVYKTLDTFVEKEILNRVKTSRDVMRYDPILESHHHLYEEHSERIEDYFDKDLNQYLQEYFEKKSIPGFRIEEVVLQIKGKFESEG